MSEEEWLACTKPEAMVEALQLPECDRKLRLMMAASMRHSSVGTSPSIKQAEKWEGFADNNATLLGDNIAERKGTAFSCIEFFSGILFPHRSKVSRSINEANQCGLLRDIFGNPFRPVKLDPRWLSSTVLDLARTIYDERTSERLPILADALMDAGCDSEEIIQHCQGPGPHVRGCWVVDLLLGKE